MEKKGHHKTPGRLKNNTSIRSECKRRHHTITFLHMDIPWTWISKFQDGKPRGEERSYNTPAGRQCWFKICAKILPVFSHQKVSGPRARHMQNPMHTVQSLERFAANSTKKNKMQRENRNAAIRSECKERWNWKRIHNSGTPVSTYASWEQVLPV
jgi:hypothetical protein